MPAGLQVWDAQGRLVVNLTDRLARVVSSVYLNGTAGSLYNAVLAQGQAFAAFQPERIFAFIDGDVSRPIISLSNGTIAWSYSSANGTHNYRQVGWLFYGVY